MLFSSLVSPAQVLANKAHQPHPAPGDTVSGEEALSIQQPHHCNGVVTSNWPLLTSQRKTPQQSKLWFWSRYKWKNSTINISSIADKNLQFLWILNFLGSSWSTPSSTLVDGGVSCFTVLQELQHCLNFLPARTQDHCYGLQTKRNSRCGSKTGIRSLKVRWRWSCTISDDLWTCVHIQYAFSNLFSSQTILSQQKRKPSFWHHSMLFVWITQAWWWSPLIPDEYLHHAIDFLLLCTCMGFSKCFRPN